MKLRLSIPQLFAVILFISLFVMATRPVLDADFWWHLRTGQWIVENRAIPSADPFSFTFEGKTWTAHEWLSETIIYGIYKLGGFALLALVFAGVITLAYFIAYRRSMGQPYIAGFVMVLGAIASAPIWGVRPQMFTLLFFSLYLYLLDKYFENGNLKLIIPLPLLMIIWINLHAGYALGLVVMGIFIGGKIIEAYLPNTWLDDELPPSRKFLLPAIGIFIASIVAVAFNPNGIYMFIYPLETLGSNAMMTFIIEWFSPNFHATEWLPLAGLMMVLLASGLFSRKRSSITEIALSVVMFYAALRSMRNVPLFAVAVIPVISHHLNEIFPIKVGRTNPSKIINIANIIILTIVIILGIAQTTSVLLSQKESEKDYFPVEAVEWIKANHPEGNIYNTYGWGGYLVWHLYPDYKVYIDGRADVYGDVFMRDFRNIYDAQPGWEEKLDKAGVNLVLAEMRSPIANALIQSESWDLVITDNLSTLFERK